jgi:acetate kinase
MTSEPPDHGHVTITVNAGAVTLALHAVTTNGDTTATVRRDPWTPADRSPFEEIESMLSGPVRLVAHRVVHGGARFDSAVEIDDDVVASIDALSELAPLQHPRIVEAIEVARRRWPDATHVAEFDTSFHRTLPPAASTYPLPRDWTSEWGIRRFGFHGLSHQHVARTAPAIVGGRGPLGKIISCHVGSGVSMCAVRDGVSVDTTMGFTPLEGPMMTTRSGSVDPGLLMWLLSSGRITIDALDRALRESSGLAGVSGTSGDLRDVIAASGRGDPDAQLALDMYARGLARGVAEMVVSAGGIDVLAFTGGVIENLPDLRRTVVDQLTFLGLDLDDDVNPAVIERDALISSASSDVAVVLVANGEHLELAFAAERLAQRMHAADLADTTSASTSSIGTVRTTR